LTLNLRDMHRVCVVKPARSASRDEHWSMLASSNPTRWRE